MTFSESLEKIVDENSNGLLGCNPIWCRITLSDVASILNGFAFPSSKFSNTEGKPLLRIRDVLSDKTKAYFNDDYDPSYLIKTGDLVIGMDGDFNCALWRGPEALLNQRVCKVTPNEKYYNLKLLFYALPGYLSAINAATSSVTVKHLSSRTVADIPLPLPPLPEQRRIVARIEELFTQLDAGVSALETAWAQLARYRQSVLKAAVEGRLTEEWRRDHPDAEPASVLLERIGKEREKSGKGRRRKKLPPLDVSVLPKLPEGWEWANIQQISHLVTDGDHNPPKRVESGIPHLTAKNIINWSITEEGCTYISEESFEKVRKRYDPCCNDVIITCVGTVGRTAIVPDNYVFSADRNLAVVRLVPNGMHPKFLQLNLNTSAAQRSMTSASGSTAQPHFYLADIRAFPVSLAPFSEQHAVIEEVERRLSVADQTEATLEANLRRAARLRQSILKKAFRGDLVPQDPNDEPASVLLERIRAERPKAPSKRRRGRPRKKTATQTELI